MPIIPNKLAIKIGKAYLDIKALFQLANFENDCQLMTPLINYNQDSNSPIEFGFALNRVYFYPKQNLITIDKRSNSDFIDIALQLGFILDS